MDLTKDLMPIDGAGDPPGIVVLNRSEPPRRPRITAFIWGGPERPQPTLPFGRWKLVSA